MKVTDCIECPKCHKPFLKQDKQDWYCHKCHTDFTTHELVYQWGLDAGDLFGDIGAIPWATNSPVDLEYPMPFEPDWITAQERSSAYQMVSRMFLGISEIDDYADMLATQEDALGIGVQ